MNAKKSKKLLSGFDIYSQKRQSKSAKDIIQIRSINSPIILSIPHAGTWIPPEAKDHVINKKSLLTETDLFTDIIYAGIGEIASTVSTQVSPCVINVNRGNLHKPHEMIKKTLPVLKQKILIKHYTAAQRKKLIAKYYKTYHQALVDLIKRAKKQYGFALLIDTHSMYPVGSQFTDDPGKKRPHFNISDSEGRTCPKKVMQAFLKDLRKTVSPKKWQVWLNRPYKGGQITKKYGKPKTSVYVIQIETQNGTYRQNLNNYRLKKQNVIFIQKSLQQVVITATKEAFKLHTKPDNC